MIELEAPIVITEKKKLSISSSDNYFLSPSNSIKDTESNATSPSSTNEIKHNNNFEMTSTKTIQAPLVNDYSKDPLHKSDEKHHDIFPSSPRSFHFIRRHTTNDLYTYKLDEKNKRASVDTARISEDIDHNRSPIPGSADNSFTHSDIHSPGYNLHSQRSKPIKRLSFDQRLSIDSANTEISKLRNSIMLKRGLTKRFSRKKASIDDEENLIGNKITEGHVNYVLAYNMLTGIRVAVSRCSGIMKQLTDKDFSNYEKLTFSMDGSEMTPSSKYDFKFKDYCPEVFRDLRNKFGLDQADYLISITGKYILSELGSPGKSGSFFYYSRDFRFIIKTIHHSEHKQLRRILKQYHSHVKSNPNTLVSQIYGLHRVKMPLTNGVKRKVHFIVMNNLFPPHRDIHIKYDLKGSTWGRYTKQDGSETSKPLKDLNWLENYESIKFGPTKQATFLKQLQKDVAFLKSVNVMDYSLLLGIHNTKQKSLSENSITNIGKASKKLSIFDPESTDKNVLIKTNPRLINSEDLPTDVYPGRSKFIFYGHDGGIRSTNMSNEPENEIYYLGIIDFLTNYSLRKRMETFWRSLSHKRETISALPSDEYGDRFLNFIKGCITKPKQD